MTSNLKNLRRAARTPRDMGFVATASLLSDAADEIERL